MDSYIMKAEWDQHQATWLAWPYDLVTFPDSKLAKVEKAYIQIIKMLSVGERIYLLVRDGTMKNRVSDILVRESIDILKITFHIVEYADVWMRDYGPMFVSNLSTDEKSWIKWRYNAYGEKFPDLLKDNEVFIKLKKEVSGFCVEVPVFMEGGALEINGKGTLITTVQCLCNPNRNPKLSVKEIEDVLKKTTGVRKIIWLPEGIVNDHTDGHIDDVVKFVDPNTLLCGYEDNANDPNFKILDDNYKILEQSCDQDGKPFRLIKLPMPHYHYSDGTKAPASYANFYIGNSVVLVPTYNDPNDSLAIEIVSKLFPNKKTVGIDCTELIYGGGAIHCITMQEPDFR